MLPVVRAVFALAAFAFVQQTAAPPPEPDALFARAVAAAREDALPPYAAYTVVVKVVTAGKTAVSSWDTTEDIRHGIVLASAFSKEERVNPATPHGVNIVARRKFQLSAPRSLNAGIDPATNLSINSNPMNPERNGDAVGPVALAIDQKFGLLPARAYRVANDERTVVAGADELTVIGRTAKNAQRYRVALLDVADGVAHLELTPLRDAYHNRLREVWVHLDTAYVDEAIVQGVGDRPPFDRTRWDVTFDRHDGGTYVSEADSIEPMTVGHGSPQVSISFENLALLTASPIKKTAFGIESPVRYLRDP